MNNRARGRFPLHSALLATVLALGASAAPGAVQAADPIGLYVGGAYGQAHIRAQLGGLGLSSNYAILGRFDSTHSAYQAMLGIRPISFLGGEVTYMDFGQSSVGNPSFSNALPLQPTPYPSAVRASQKGEAAYALLYLPVPIVDVYLKAGMSRITTDTSATYVLAGVGTCQVDNPNCGSETIRRTMIDTSFAYGAGLQWKLGQWAVRGEYERFDAAGSNPSLLSVGMTYWIF